MSDSVMMRARGLETNVPEVVPCFVDGVVQDDERSAWSQRVAEEVVRLSVDAVVRGYVWLVGEGA